MIYKGHVFWGALFWGLLALVAAGILFSTSQNVTRDRAVLEKIERDLADEEDSLRVLRAEWSYLNQPERLEKLARHHLRLGTAAARQFTTARDLDDRSSPAMAAPDARGQAATATVLSAGASETRGFHDVLNTLRRTP